MAVARAKTAKAEERVAKAQAKTKDIARKGSKGGRPLIP
jgi:hypothetical protein